VKRKRKTAVFSDPIEHSLISAKLGSFSALGQLLDYYRDYLLRVANEELQSGLAAKVAPSDIVQETFLQAAQGFGQFAGKTEPELRAWLRQILIHNLYDTQRHFGRAQRNPGREVPLPDDAGSTARGVQIPSLEPGPNQQVEQFELQSRVHTCLARLPADQALVIELRIFAGLQFDQIGTAMERSSEAARKLFARAIRNLANEMIHDVGQ
jgi:RNA polymerase sigma-70 factor (ECF subfamily)